MSVNNTEDRSRIDDYFSAKSTFSDGALSLESITNISNEPNALIQKITSLHDRRYDATYQLTQCRYRFAQIEKLEFDLMKESTVEQSQLQKGYLKDERCDNQVNELAQKAAEHLGILKYDLNQIDEQLNTEQQKLEELEEQIEKIIKRIDDSSNAEEKKELTCQKLILEEQREAQSKIFEDLEFKQLEMLSKFEEESEQSKRGIIEAQKNYLMITRDRENHKSILDEQQLKLMRATREQLERLESERNYCHQQITYYQSLVNNCTSRIEKLSRHLEQSKASDLFNTMDMYNYRSNRSGSLDTGMLLNPSNGTYNNNHTEQSSGVYGVLSDYSSLPNGYNIREQSQCSPSFVSSFTGDDEIQTLADLVGYSASPNHNSENPPIADTNDENGFRYNSSLVSLTDSDHSNNHHRLSNNSSLIAQQSDTTLHKKIPIVSFQHCDSIGESLNSTQSPHSATGSNHYIKTSKLSNSSDNSSNADNSIMGKDGFIKPSSTTVLRNRHNNSNMSISRESVRSKQARPLTCFLPKLHSDFDLRAHIESCGHNLTVCGAPNTIKLESTTCQGYLWKLAGQRNIFGTRPWNKRWFYFDHTNKQLTYYSSHNKTKIKGTIDFKDITDVFIDHNHRTKRPQKLSFCIETINKTYYLMASKPELISLWIDVIFTGAEGYLNLHHPTIPTYINNHNTNHYQ